MVSEEVTRLRQCEGAINSLIGVLLIAIPVWALAYLLDLHIYLGMRFTLPQFVGGFLGLVLSLTFLLFPATKRAPNKKVPWYDVILGFLGLAVGIYLVLYHPDIEQRHYVVTRFEVFLGATAILLILEASRRSTGWCLPIMGLSFIFYALYSNFFPGILQSKGYSFGRVVPYLYFTESGILGDAMHMAATIVLAYILFGQALLDSGCGKVLSELCLSLVGRFRGGPAKVAIIASALFGTMSGSPGANVAVTGTFTIPMMINAGYKRQFAAAVEAVAATGGVVMPPVMGVVAFLMAEFLGVSYAQVAVAAFLPALLYYIGLFSQVDFEAVKQGLRGLSPEEMPKLRSALRNGWQLLFPIAVLVYFLLIARITAATAGLYATVATIFASMWRQESRLGPRRLLSTLRSTGQNMLDIGIVCAYVGIIVGSLYLTGLGVNFSIMLTSLAGGNVFILLVLAAVASFVLGTGMPSVPSYALLAILVAPALESMGVDRFAAHLFLVYYGAMSFITPPVAPSAVVAAGLANASYMATGWQACRLGIVAYLVPFVFVFKPTLLMKGGIVEIILTFVISTLGVILLAAGLEGCLFRRVNWGERILFLIGGLGLFVPNWKTNTIGALVVAFILFKERQALRRLYRHPSMIPQGNGERGDV